MCHTSKNLDTYICIPLGMYELHTENLYSQTMVKYMCLYMKSGLWIDVGA